MIDFTYDPIIPADYKSQRERTSLRSLSLGTVLAFYVNSRLLVAQILVDGLGAQLTGTHSQNDGGSTGNGIAAREYMRGVRHKCVGFSLNLAAYDRSDLRRWTGRWLR